MNKSLNLEKQIKQQITNRIVCCGILFFCMLFVTTLCDFYINIDQLTTSLNVKANELSNFITTQVLIGNQQAIIAHLNKINHGSIIFQWIPYQTSKIVTPKIFQEILWTPSLHWSYFYRIPTVGTENFGYLKISSSLWKDTKLTHNLLFRSGILMLFFIGILFFLYPLAKRIPNELFVTPIKNILSMLKTSRKEDYSSPKILLATELQTIQSEIINLLEGTKQQSHKEALLLIASQVAHDIRSPLAALNIMIKTTDSIPEQHRIMIRNATQRINDIANNLLLQHRQSINTPKESDIETPSSKELVAALLDQVVSEKRMQFQDKQILITFNAKKIYGIFAEISAVDFKRVISNIINNAAESITQNGTIDITLKDFTKELCIEISDNGCGIPSELQQKVLLGSTVGKKEGNGIGLSSSKRLVESWGGTIKLESEINQGTTISIFLPKSSPADWFIPELVIFNDDTIIILDDDQSIHDVWTSYITQHFNAFAKITLCHYYQAELLMEDIKNIPLHAKFLVDYEFHNSNLTGLDIIKSLGIASRTTLVTSRDEELDIRLECKKIGVKILPKVYASLIPINIYTKNPECVNEWHLSR